MRSLIKKILREDQHGTYHRSGDVEEWRISPYEYSTKNYKELIDALDKLPNTIRDLTIPTEVQVFNPSTVTFTPETDSDWKKKVKEIITALLRRGKILSWSLNSYYGTSSKDYDNHPYYISYVLPGSKEFAERMSSGALGSLD